MTATEFIQNYSEDKLNNISTVLLIQHNMNNGKYYKIPISGNIEITAPFTTWSYDYFRYHINYIGVMGPDLYIHMAKKEAFQSLDEFMYYSRANEDVKINLNLNNFVIYPYRKEENLSKSYFMESQKIWIYDVFAFGLQEFFTVDFSNYQEGYFYRNNSFVRMGCDLSDKYFGFSYEPY